MAPASNDYASLGTRSLKWKNMYAINLVLQPLASTNPVNNGEMTFERVSDTSLRIKLKGSDGVVRSVTLNLT